MKHNRALSELQDEVIAMAMKCRKRMERLDEIEGELQRIADMEENGRLLRLPCRIGDPVYRVERHDCKQSKEKRLRVMERAFKYSDIPNWNKKVFLTRAEAEAARNRQERQFPCRREGVTL